MLLVFISSVRVLDISAQNQHPQPSLFSSHDLLHPSGLRWSTEANLAKDAPIAELNGPSAISKVHRAASVFERIVFVPDIEIN
ncbi:hypothetical protein MMC20_002485 [Loxospora ochrophaea]|nr:hypothetical protein [Loxospora ochrophaea]